MPLCAFSQRQKIRVLMPHSVTPAHSPTLTNNDTNPHSVLGLMCLLER